MRYAWWVPQRNYSLVASSTGQRRPLCWCVNSFDAGPLESTGGSFVAKTIVRLEKRDVPSGPSSLSVLQRDTIYAVLDEVHSTLSYNYETNDCLGKIRLPLLSRPSPFNDSPISQAFFVGYKDYSTFLQACDFACNSQKDQTRDRTRHILCTVSPCIWYMQPCRTICFQVVGGRSFSRSQ
ncbi:hypothetical protein VTO42DRAFT_3515 [Malbranchea cinnamomea]